MNKTLIGIVVLLIIVLGGWYFVSKGQTPKMAEGPMKVGVILPLSGDAANLGEPSRNVMQIAADEINANGEKVQLIFEDGACDGKTAANAMQKLVNVDHVQVVIGGACSGESLSAEPIGTQAKVAMLSAFSSSPKLTGISPYFARNYPSDSFQGSVTANIAYTDKGYKKIAFIQEQTDYALGIYTAFSDTFTKLGGTVVNESFPTEATDFKTSLSKLKAANPDALFIDVQSSPSGQKILKQLSDMGWKPKLFLSDTVTGDTATVTQYKGLLEGAIGAEFGADPTNSKFANLIATYKAKYGSEPTYQAYMQTAYDAVYLVRDAIDAVGYDGTKVANWLHTSVKNWQGASGSITIGADGDPTVGHRPEVIMGGKTEPYVK